MSYVFSGCREGRDEGFSHHVRTHYARNDSAAHGREGKGKNATIALTPDSRTAVCKCNPQSEFDDMTWPFFVGIRAFGSSNLALWLTGDLENNDIDANK